MTPTILIAGIGNIFLGDDAFGVEVALSLSRRQLPDCVSVKDFGIRGFDLAYSLLDPWDAVILADALPRGETPGTIFLIEPALPSPDDLSLPDTAMNPHGMDPVRVLNLAASMGPISAQVFLVGCEPNDFGDELEGRMGLSVPVQAAVEEASDMIEQLVGRILATKKLQPSKLQTMER
jgi:hydrogenase maturation protease